MHLVPAFRELQQSPLQGCTQEIHCLWRNINCDFQENMFLKSSAGIPSLLVLPGVKKGSPPVSYHFLLPLALSSWFSESKEVPAAEQIQELLESQWWQVILIPESCWNLILMCTIWPICVFLDGALTINSCQNSRLYFHGLLILVINVMTVLVLFAFTSAIFCILNCSRYHFFIDKHNLQGCCSQHLQLPGFLVTVIVHGIHQHWILIQSQVHCIVAFVFLLLWGWHRSLLGKSSKTTLCSLLIKYLQFLHGGAKVGITVA